MHKRSLRAALTATAAVAISTGVAFAAEDATGHGAEVSAVAKAVQTVSGQSHGEAVSAIAKTHGAEVSAAARAKGQANAAAGKAKGQANAAAGKAKGAAASEPGRLKAGAASGGASDH